MHVKTRNQSLNILFLFLLHIVLGRSSRHLVCRYPRRSPHRSPLSLRVGYFPGGRFCLAVRLQGRVLSVYTLGLPGTVSSWCGHTRLCVMAHPSGVARVCATTHALVASSKWWRCFRCKRATEKTFGHVRYIPQDNTLPVGWTSAFFCIERTRGHTAVGLYPARLLPGTRRVHTRICHYYLPLSVRVHDTQRYEVLKHRSRVFTVPRERPNPLALQYFLRNCWSVGIPTGIRWICVNLLLHEPATCLIGGRGFNCSIWRVRFMIVFVFFCLYFVWLWFRILVYG